MLVNTGKQQFEVGGVVESREVAITASSMVKIAGIVVSQMYSDKVLAVVREILTNAYEVSTDKPPVIHLPTTLEPWWGVRDFGPGMSDDFVMTHYPSLGYSTKDADANAIGGFGTGSKSPWAYSDSFSVISIYQGTRTTYTCTFDRESMPVVHRVDSAPTDEPSGVQVVVPVSPDDTRRFVTLSHELTRYWPKNLRPELKNHGHQLPDVEICPAYGSDTTYRIRTGTDASWGTSRRFVSSSNYTIDPALFGGLTAVVGVVPYPVSYNAAWNGASRTVKEEFNRHTKLVGDVFVASLLMYFSPAELRVTPSREGLEYTRETCDALLLRMVETAKQVAEDLSADFRACDSLPDAIELLHKRVGAPYGGTIVFDDVDPQKPVSSVLLPSEYVTSLVEYDAGHRLNTHVNVSALTSAAKTLPSRCVDLRFDNVLASKLLRTGYKPHSYSGTSISTFTLSKAALKRIVVIDRKHTWVRRVATAYRTEVPDTNAKAPWGYASDQVLLVRLYTNGSDVPITAACTDTEKEGVRSLILQTLQEVVGPSLQEADLEIAFASDLPLVKEVRKVTRGRNRCRASVMKRGGGWASTSVSASNPEDDFQTDGLKPAYVFRDQDRAYEVPADDDSGEVENYLEVYTLQNIVGKVRSLVPGLFSSVEVGEDDCLGLVAIAASSQEKFRQGMDPDKWDCGITRMRNELRAIAEAIEDQGSVKAPKESYVLALRRYEFRGYVSVISSCNSYQKWLAANHPEIALPWPELEEWDAAIHAEEPGEVSTEVVYQSPTLGQYVTTHLSEREIKWLVATLDQLGGKLPDDSLLVKIHAGRADLNLQDNIRKELEELATPIQKVLDEHPFAYLALAKTANDGYIEPREVFTWCPLRNTRERDGFSSYENADLLIKEYRPVVYQSLTDYLLSNSVLENGDSNDLRSK